MLLKCLTDRSGKTVQNQIILKEESQGRGVGAGGGDLLVNLVPMLEKKKKKKTMKKGTFFQAGQCAALSSFRVRWHFSGKRVGFFKSDK